MIAYAGMFQDEEKAKTAVQDLMDSGFNDGQVVHLEPARGPTLNDELKQAHHHEVLNGVASRVRTSLEAGHHVVAVNAPLGNGQLAVDILESSGAEKIVSGGERDVKFFSQAFGLPLLSSRRMKGELSDPHPFSSLFRMPLLATPRGQRRASFGIPLLTKGRRSRSRIGFPLLTKDRTHMMSFIPLVIRTKARKRRR
ncbi:MAG: hypothetical protein ACFB9M_00630 [Myxococcota bacterium]